MHRLARSATICGAALVVVFITTAAQTDESKESVTIPEVVGLAASDAKAAVVAAGLVPKFQLGDRPASRAKALIVYAQYPPAGKQLFRGEPVKLTVYAPAAVGKSPSASDGEQELTRVLVAPSLRSGAELIDPRSGDLSLTVTDLAVQAGLVQLEVRRALQTHPGPAGLLGRRWRLNWERRLVKSGTNALLIDLTQARHFKLDKASQRFRSAAGDSLAVTADGAVCTTPGGTTETFDAQGRLIQRALPHGQKVILRYDAAGRLARVEGPFKSFLNFVTDGAGRLTRVESSTGATVQYFYGDKTAATQPAAEAQAVGYAYDASGALLRISHPRFGDKHFAYDVRSRVTSRRWADGAEERFEYDDATNTRRHIDPAGQVTTTRKSPDGRRIEIIDPLKRKSVIESDAAGRPVRIAGPTGLEACFTYDALGRLVSVQNPATGTTRFEYLNDTRMPTQISAPDGKLCFTYDSQKNLLSMSSDKDKAASATFEYFPDGLVKTAKTGDGQERSFSYDAAGRRASITDAAGNQWRFEYDGQGNLVRTTDPRGGITARTYDAQGRLTSLTDPVGRTTRWKRALQGRRYEVAVTNPRGGVTLFVYDQRGRLLNRTGPGDRTVRYNYDVSGRRTSLTDAGRTYRLEYDAGGNLLHTVNPSGGITKRTYDAMDRLTSFTDAAGATVQNEYSSIGLLTKSVDRTGRATEYEYSAQGRLLAVIADAQRTARYEHDSSGRVTRVVPPSGPAVDLAYEEHGRLASVRRGKLVLVRYEYDILGRTTKETRATGLEISYRYDALGNLTAWEDNQGGRGTFDYDAAGRLTAATDATGATTNVKFDPAGKWQEAKNPLGNVKRLAYEESGRLSEVVEPGGSKAHYEYNPAGQINVIHHPAGGSSLFEFDALGLLTLGIDPIGNQTKAKYDSASRIISTTDAKGQTTSFAYDPAGRLSQKRLADGKLVTYRYNPRGQLSAVDDGVFPIRYTHDLHGRLTKIEYRAIKRSLKFEYNDLGLRTKLVDSEGRTVRYEYDAYDRLTAMKYGKDQSITFAYDPKSRPTSVVYPNGVKGTWEYGASGRPAKLTYTDAGGNVVAGWTYTYDAVGNCAKTVADQGPTSRCRYDASSQLAEEDMGDGKPVKYTYGPGGNRASREANGKTVRYDYDKADRLRQAGPEKFAHDANGNVVERRGPNGIARYSYDTENRLVKVVLPDGAEVSYGYAPTGQRIWRRDASGLTYFVTDGVNLLAELGEDLKARARYLHGPGVDHPLVMVRKGQSYAFHADRLGTVQRITDQTGAVVAAYDYDAFGEMRSRSGTLQSPFTFTARERDVATGLYYHRARYYDAGLGRFLSKDPVAAGLHDPLALNPYPYARNNPVRFVDGMGLEATELPTTNPLPASSVSTVDGPGAANNSVNIPQSGPGAINPLAADPFPGMSPAEAASAYLRGRATAFVSVLEEMLGLERELDRTEHTMESLLNPSPGSRWTDPTWVARRLALARARSAAVRQELTRLQAWAAAHPGEAAADPLGNMTDEELMRLFPSRGNGPGSQSVPATAPGPPPPEVETFPGPGAAAPGAASPGSPAAPPEAAPSSGGLSEGSAVDLQPGTGSGGTGSAGAGTGSKRVDS